MFVDIQIREHEHGDIVYTGNGDMAEELAHIIQKYGMTSKIFDKILEYRKPEIMQ